jgi:hypothetical protein
MFLAAVIVAAAVIGLRELSGPAMEKRGVTGAPDARSQALRLPSANATGSRFASIAAIPLSPQPPLLMDEAPVASPAPASVPHPSPENSPAVVVGDASDHEIPPALTAIPDALAKASSLPRRAGFTAMKAADKRSVGPSKAVTFARHRHDVPQRFVGYAEAIAKLSHSRELSAALRSFL